MRRAINFLRRAWLRWCIHDMAMYLRACERDGLTDSLSLRAFRGQLEEMECELIALQPRALARSSRRAA